MNKKSNKNISAKMIYIVAALLVIVTAATYVIKNKGISDKGASENQSVTVKTVKDNDIVIPVSSVTDKVTFYPAVIDGTKLEVMAVKAPDGSIRTAFNTCQVCYSSGRGYYKQEGDELVCQNCGNRFKMSDVEKTKGGCNPVPITSDYKKTDSANITISKDYLKEATVIFQNWKQ